VLLEQRDQEVDGQVDVLDEFILGHLDVADGDVQAQDLFHLELDGRLQIVDLLFHVVIVRQEGREFTGLVKTGTEKTGNLLDQGFGGQESVVLLSQLLDLLLLFVQFLEVIGGHASDVLFLGLVDMLLVSKNADRELGPGNMAQLDSAGETLVLLGIVVLEADLQVYGLGELAFLGLLGVFENLSYAFVEGFLGNFARHCFVFVFGARIEGLVNLLRSLRPPKLISNSRF